MGWLKRRKARRRRRARVEFKKCMGEVWEGIAFWFGRRGVECEMFAAAGKAGEPMPPARLTLDDLNNAVTNIKKGR